MTTQQNQAFVPCVRGIDRPRAFHTTSHPKLCRMHGRSRLERGGAGGGGGEGGGGTRGACYSGRQAGEVLHRLTIQKTSCLKLLVVWGWWGKTSRLKLLVGWGWWGKTSRLKLLAGWGRWGLGSGRKGVWPKSKKTDGARTETEALQIGNEVARGGRLCVRFGDGQNRQSRGAHSDVGIWDGGAQGKASDKISPTVSG